MKRILLTQGKFAIVDDEDYEWLNQYKWYAAKSKNTYYAVRSVWNKKTKSYKQVSMHRLIMGLLKDKQIDHINHNGLDNRRCNLRICTQSQNFRNGRAHKNTTSIFKGVSWYSPEGCWQTFIYYNKKNKNLGLYDKEIGAAKAYDQAARELFGEFANCNFS